MSAAPGSPRLHLPAGTAAGGGYDVVVTPRTAGWSATSLRVLTLRPGQEHRLATEGEEMLVVPLSGACMVHCDGQQVDLHGRRGVFAAVTDVAYLPCGAEVDLVSVEGGRFALAGALATQQRPLAYRPAAEVAVEVRGAGACTRQVNDLCSAGSLEADALIVVEVLTPGGNWSSYPPHKHDEAIPGEEAELEEIYYFEMRDRGEGGRPLGYHRVYGTAQRPLDVLAEVGAGDVVLVPYGWHGPSMAAPGYDMYYLNVMAGPAAERDWLIRDDPDHAWVRSTWEQQEGDPRVPMTRPVQAERG